MSAGCAKARSAIYYISGESAQSLRTSPQLEQATAKGVEVLLLEDPVDEFWVPEAKDYDGKPFASLTKGDIDLSGIADKEVSAEPAPAVEGGELDRLVAKLKLALGEEVKDVRPSKRLKESAVCLVAEDQGLDLRLERFLKQHSQIKDLAKRVLEINPQALLIRRMAALAAGGRP